MKKILTFTLRHSLGDCTNNGLTSQKDSIDMYYGSAALEYLMEHPLELPSEPP